MFCHSAAEESLQLLGSCEASSVAAGDWDLLEQLGMPTGGVLREEEAVQVDSSEFSSVPEDPLPPAGGVDPQGMGSPPAFPVFKAVPGSGQPDRQDPISWCVVKIYRTR